MKLIKREKGLVSYQDDFGITWNLKKKRFHWDLEKSQFGNSAIVSSFKKLQVGQKYLKDNRERLIQEITISASNLTGLSACSLN